MKITPFNNIARNTFKDIINFHLCNVRVAKPLKCENYSFKAEPPHTDPEENDCKNPKDTNLG